MPNEKPHLDGHLSVGTRRVIGDIKHTLKLSADTIQRVSANDGAGRKVDDGSDDDGDAVRADSYQDLCKSAGL